MTTKDAFQQALSAELEKIRTAGYILGNPSNYDLRFEPADNAGKLLAQAKEFLTPDEYECMLDTLSLNPLEAVFLLDRLKRQSLFAVSHDLLQAFHEEARIRALAFAKKMASASPKERQRLLKELIEEELKMGERMDRELPVILPIPFTREELRRIYAHGDPLSWDAFAEEKELSLEEKIERYFQQHREMCAKLSSGHYHSDRIAETLKNILEHPDWFLEEDEE